MGLRKVRAAALGGMMLAAIFALPLQATAASRPGDERAAASRPGNEGAAATATTTEQTGTTADCRYRSTARPATTTSRSPVTLNVVAHEDDDLLFINPAVSDDIEAGRCVVTLFVTAGDAGRRPSYWRAREQGAMAAYAEMAGTPNEWAEDTMVVAGRGIARFTLLNSSISLLFLRLPDGHGNPARPGETLQRLWRGEITAVRPLTSGDRYTRNGLVATLTALMDAITPDEIRTLDYMGSYGDGDHNDHHTAAYFTYEAQKHYRTPHHISGYMGYPMENEPENLPDPVREEKLAVFLAYAPYDVKVCQSADSCTANFYGPRFTRSVATHSEFRKDANVARSARVTASAAQHAAYTAAIGTGEWATPGRTGAWMSLTWPTSRRLAQIDLRDRTNSRDQVLAGLLEFSDGTRIRVAALPNNGATKHFRFPPRNVTGVRLKITAVSGTTKNAGVAAISAYTAPSAQGAPN
nr:PIG-L family deacetylase [uncultured Actinoplanes sp.]